MTPPVRILIVEDDLCIQAAATRIQNVAPAEVIRLTGGIAFENLDRQCVAVRICPAIHPEQLVGAEWIAPSAGVRRFVAGVNCAVSSGIDGNQADAVCPAYF